MLCGRGGRAHAKTNFELKMSPSVIWNSTTDLGVAQVYLNFSQFISS